jgi:hypothetical protein
MSANVFIHSTYNSMLSAVVYLGIVVISCIILILYIKLKN